MSEPIWTREQVSSLNDRQQCGYLHPYTCGKCGADLVATCHGWSCPKAGCDYEQKWCAAEDANGEWRKWNSWGLMGDGAEGESNE